MTIRSHGELPTPDHERIHRATEPRLRGPVPALLGPAENADLVLAKPGVLLNRAGSNPGNPILSGIGVTAQFGIGSRDRIRGAYIFQDRGQMGPNLIGDVSKDGLTATLGFLAGSGRSVAGSPSTGAVRNFIRWVTAQGAVEKQFWVKSRDADAVAVNGQASVDPDSFETVPITVEIVNAGADWLDCLIDFFVSWNDEFHNLHNRNADDKELGNLKAYGGAAFVSFFDTDGEEGVDGVQVNLVTQAEITTRHTLQVQNTAGTKLITARFRSEKDSLYFVDVPIEILVVDASEECIVPAAEPCSDVYTKIGTDVPEGFPSIASTPEVQVVEGPDAEASIDLIFITVRGAVAGAAPKIRIRRWAYTESAVKLAGAALVEVGDPEDYLPLLMPSSTPLLDPPYQAPKRYTIALSVIQLYADNVALITATLVDGDHISEPVPVLGPRARDLGYLPLGGVGGGPICGY